MLEKNTKILVRDKLKKMKRLVGYPVELLDMAKLEEYFADLDMKTDKLFENFVQIQKRLTRKGFEKLREAVNRTDWKIQDTPAKVNAEYDQINCPTECHLDFCIYFQIQVTKKY